MTTSYHARIAAQERRMAALGIFVATPATRRAQSTAQAAQVAAAGTDDPAAVAALQAAGAEGLAYLARCRALVDNPETRHGLQTIARSAA